MSKPSRPLTVIEQTRRCPFCAAQPGERCTTPAGLNYPPGVHAGRERAVAVPRPRSHVTLTRAQQLRAYFALLIRLAEKTEDKQRRDDLFDRIERTLDEIGTEDAHQAGSLGQLMRDWAELADVLPLPTKPAP